MIFYPQGWQTNDKTRAPRRKPAPMESSAWAPTATATACPEGQYVMTVVHCPLVQIGSDSVPGPNVLPNKYASPKTSDLRVEVVKGANTLPRTGAEIIAAESARTNRDRTERRRIFAKRPYKDT